MLQASEESTMSKSVAVPIGGQTGTHYNNRLAAQDTTSQSFPLGEHESRMQLVSSEEKATALFLLLDFGRKRNVVKVHVSDTTRPTRGGPSAFTIQVRVGDDAKGWSVTRHYKDFKNLQRSLKSHRFPCPQLPSRNIFKVRSKGFLRKRQGAMDLWLQGTCCIWQSLYSSESNSSKSHVEVSCTPINRAIVDFLTMPTPENKPRSSRYLESLLGSPARSSAFTPASPNINLSSSLSKASPLGPSAIRRSISLPKLNLPWTASHNASSSPSLRLGNSKPSLNTVMEHKPAVADKSKQSYQLNKTAANSSHEIANGSSSKPNKSFTSYLQVHTTPVANDIGTEVSLDRNPHDNIIINRLRSRGSEDRLPSRGSEQFESDAGSYDSSSRSSSPQFPLSPAAALVPRIRREGVTGTTPSYSNQRLRSDSSSHYTKATVHDTIQFTFSGQVDYSVSPNFTEDDMFEYEDEELDLEREILDPAFDHQGDGPLQDSLDHYDQDSLYGEEEDFVIPFALHIAEQPVVRKDTSHSKRQCTQWNLFQAIVPVDHSCGIDLNGVQGDVHAPSPLSQITQQPTKHHVDCYTPVSIPPTPGGLAVFEQSWDTYTTSLLGYVAEHLIGLEDRSTDITTELGDGQSTDTATEQQPQSTEELSRVSNPSSSPTCETVTTASSPSSMLMGSSMSNTDLASLQSLMSEDEQKSPVLQPQMDSEDHSLKKLHKKQSSILSTVFGDSDLDGHRSTIRPVVEEEEPVQRKQSRYISQVSKHSHSRSHSAAQFDLLSDARSMNSCKNGSSPRHRPRARTDSRRFSMSIPVPFDYDEATN